MLCSNVLAPSRVYRNQLTQRSSEHYPTEWKGFVVPSDSSERLSSSLFSNSQRIQKNVYEVMNSSSIVLCKSDEAADASAGNSPDADDERLLASFNSRPSTGN